MPQARARDPFGLGHAAPQAVPPRPEPTIIIDDVAPEEPLPNGGEAQLREALSKASREVIERVAWEVVPQLAETIIRQELDRLIKERESR
jgi:hypothetical protein